MLGEKRHVTAILLCTMQAFLTFAQDQSLIGALTNPVSLLPTPSLVIILLVSRTDESMGFSNHRNSPRLSSLRQNQVVITYSPFFATLGQQEICDDTGCWCVVRTISAVT